MLPRRESIAVRVFDETLTPDRIPDYETPTCDVGGCVLSGVPALDVEGREIEELRPGDSFDVPRETKHRGYALGDKPVRLISFCHPANY